MARELLTWVTNTSRGSLLTFPSATDVSRCSGVPLVRQLSLNLISGGKEMGGGTLISPETVLDVHISLDSRPGEAWCKQRWTSGEWVCKRDGGVGRV